MIGWSFTNCVPSCGDLKLNFVETARYDISWGIYLNIVEHFPKANVLTLAVNGKSLDVLYHVYVSMSIWNPKLLVMWNIIVLRKNSLNHWTQVTSSLSDYHFFNAMHCSAPLRFKIATTIKHTPKDMFYRCYSIEHFLFSLKLWHFTRLVDGGHYLVEVEQ